MNGATSTTTLRNPTAEERSLIAALLNHIPEDRRRYRAQLRLAKVVGGCDCGCPSVDLSLVGRTEDLSGCEILVGGDASSPEGTPVAVILWIRDRELVSLEVHAWDDTIHFGLPRPETLKNVTLGVD